MLWGVPEAQQQPFSSVAMAVQVWQWVGKIGQEGAQAADDSSGSLSRRRSAEHVGSSADRGKGGAGCQSVSAPEPCGGVLGPFQAAALAGVARSVNLHARRPESCSLQQMQTK